MEIDPSHIRIRRNSAVKCKIDSELPRLDPNAQFGNTTAMSGTKLISVRLPLKLLRAIPGAHKGRTRFIISLWKKNSPASGSRNGNLLPNAAAGWLPCLKQAQPSAANHWTLKELPAN